MDSPKEPRRKWLLWAFALPLAPLYLVYALVMGGLMLCLVAYARPERRVGSARLRRRLTREGRVVSWAEVDAALAAAPATIVIEEPSTGWNDGLFWLVPGRVRGDAPPVVECPPQPDEGAWLDHLESQLALSAWFAPHVKDRPDTRLIAVVHSHRGLKRCRAEVERLTRLHPTNADLIEVNTSELFDHLAAREQRG
ncbi:MAG TPA: hypothetical protein VD997_11685 [Phycisphaerales bacterium]|nr:hypothetical protein [Phycisphaerales bacterium]